MSAKQKITSLNTWQAELERQLGQQRSRLRAALEARRERLQEIESGLDSRLATIRELLEEVAEHSHAHNASLETKLTDVKREEQRLAQQRTDLAKQRGHLEALYSGWEQSQQQAQTRELTVLEELARGLEELRQREAALKQQAQETAQLKLEVETAERLCSERQRAIIEAEQSLDNRELKLQQLQGKLQEQRLELQSREERLQRQRNTIARDLRRQKRELEQWQKHVAESSQRTAELESSSRKDLYEQNVETEFSLQQARSQAEKSGKRCAELDRELREAWDKIDALEKELRSSQPGDNAATSVELEQELEALREELAETQIALKKARAASKSAENEETPRTAAALYHGNEMSWETRKKSLLAQLETDFSDTNPQDRADKLTIRAVIRQTEDALNAKETEISELKRLLEEQSSKIGEFAVGAAAVAQFIESDELIQQERAKLRELQEKLLEQSKQAEIEISMERAKLARERLEMEDKLQRLEKLQAQSQGEPILINTRSESPKKQTGGGRWLSRLGLGDGEK